MNKSDRNLLIVIGAVLVIVIGGYAALVSYTGFSAPFSVVMSQSMQHDQTQSEIGVIDTGDVVIVQDPSKAEIQSYVEGTKSGYTSFGDYGSVIIYNRGGDQNPVIHRAIVWLEYDEQTDTWSAPSLADYSGSWYYIYYENGEEIRVDNEYTDIRGTLTFDSITQSGKTVSVNVDTLEKSSGFLTMGDNISNYYFDQDVSIAQGNLISYDEIRSVPIFEIPWIGTLKILVSNGGQNLQYVTNSLPSLLMCILTVFGLLMLLDGTTLYRNQMGMRYRLEMHRRCARQ